MNFGENIPGIINHETSSSINSERAITITAHKNVSNPIKTSTVNNVYNHNIIHLDTTRLKNALALAQMDVAKMTEINVMNEPKVEDCQKVENVKSNQDFVVKPQKIPTKTRQEMEILANEIYQMVEKLPQIHNKILNYTKNLISAKSDSGLDERKRSLIKLNEKSRQISRTFYSLKYSNNKASEPKILKISVKIVNLFFQILPDLVAMKNVQNDKSLSFPELDKALLPVLPVQELISIVKKLNKSETFELLASEIIKTLDQIDQFSEIVIENNQSKKSALNTLKMLQMDKKGSKMKLVGGSKNMRRRIGNVKNVIRFGKRDKKRVDQSFDNEKVLVRNNIDNDSTTIQSKTKLGNDSRMSILPKNSKKLLVKKTATQKTRELLNKRKSNKNLKCDHVQSQSRIENDNLDQTMDSGIFEIKNDVRQLNGNAQILSHQPQKFNPKPTFNKKKKKKKKK